MRGFQGAIATRLLVHQRGPMPRQQGCPTNPHALLDRGGQCQGVVFKLPPEDLEAQLQKLVRREITVKPPNNIPRWISVETEYGPLRAMAFVMNRQSRFYVAELSPEETADILAKACGHWGSCAEYLHNTTIHLAEHGIRDRNLWHLQELVAERIAKAHHG